MAILSWALIVSNIGLVLLYPQGAPSDVCTSMRPGHNAQPQRSAAQNSLELSATTYSPQTPITVTLKGDVMGFLLHVRRAGGAGGSVGTFSSPPANTKLLTCSAPGDSVTHTSRANKKDLSFTWTPPPTDQGNLIFYVTVVQTYGVFWVALASDAITYSMQAPVQVTTMSNPPPTSMSSGETMSSASSSAVPKSEPENNPGSGGIREKSDIFLFLLMTSYCILNRIYF